MTVSRSSLIKHAGDEADMRSNYEMIGKLGAGNFGFVYKARSKVTGLLRAIKEMDDNDIEGINKLSQAAGVPLSKEQKLVQKQRPKLPAPPAPGPSAASTRTIPAELGAAAAATPPGASQDVEQSLDLAPEAEQGVSAPAAAPSETDDKASRG